MSIPATQATRRSLLKLMGALPFSGQALTEAAAAKLTQTATMTAAAGLSNGIAPQPAGMAHYLLHDPRIQALISGGLLPEWVKEEITDHAAYSGRGLDPNVACLVSVSAGAKARMTREHNERRIYDGAARSFMHSQARKAFFSN